MKHNSFRLYSKPVQVVSKCCIFLATFRNGQSLGPKQVKSEHSCKTVSLKHITSNIGDIRKYLFNVNYGWLIGNFVHSVYINVYVFSLIVELINPSRVNFQPPIKYVLHMNTKAVLAVCVIFAEMKYAAAKDVKIGFFRRIGSLQR